MADKNATWRAAAKRILEPVPGTDVEQHAHVHEMADGAGAFVECIVWVPSTEVEKQSDEQSS